MHNINGKYVNPLLLEKFTGGGGSSIAGCFVEDIELPGIST